MSRSRYRTGVLSPDLRKTPLTSWHHEHGGRLVDYAGWAMPVQYAGVKAEHAAVRQGVGVFDVSHMGQLHVRGEGALGAVNRLITNDLERAVDSQAVYTCCCNDRGTILDDLIVYRLQADHVLVVCNAANRSKIVPHFETALRGFDVSLDEQAALIALQGPGSEALLDALLETATGSLFQTLRPFRTGVFQTRSEVTAFPQRTSFRAARTGYTGEDGVELFCSEARAAGLWQTLVDAGAQPCGLAARDTLRLEAALCLYGNDIDESTTPLEAGLGWTVKFDKSDFVGKEALLRQQQAGLTRRLVGFEMTGRGIARAGYPLLDPAGKEVGHCTSGSPSPTLGTSIGLGYVPLPLTELGSELIVDCRGRHVPAKVVKTPFYRRAKR